MLLYLKSKNSAGCLPKRKWLMKKLNIVIWQENLCPFENDFVIRRQQTNPHDIKNTWGFVQVCFCFWVDRAVLGSTENSEILLKYSYLWKNVNFGLKVSFLRPKQNKAYTFNFVCQSILHPFYTTWDVWLWKEHQAKINQKSFIVIFSSPKMED